jgi:pimeloyl-ACP methyl ester carboxylesterase
MNFSGCSAALAVVTASLVAGCAMHEIPYSDLAARYALTSSRTFEPEPGLRVHCTDEGNQSGRTLILVHGFAASVHAWRPWIERVGGEHRLIALDLPGHGLTEAPKDYQASLDKNAALVGAIADHVGVSRFVLVGNSMGGAVSLNFARAHSDRLDGLVLVDAAGWPGESEQQAGGPPLVFSLLNNGFGRFILKLFDPRWFAKDALKSAYLDATLVNEALINRYGDLALAPGHRDILLTQQSRPGTPFTRADFAALQVPTLVLAGEQDKLIPADQSRAIADAIPGARLVIYPDGGHVPMEQLPERSAEDLRVFLKGLPKR